MSNKKLALQLIESIPDYKMGFVVAYLQGISAADEAEDDLYCKNLYETYLDDQDPQKCDSVSIESLAADLGVKL